MFKINISLSLCEELRFGAPTSFELRSWDRFQHSRRRNKEKTETKLSIATLEKISIEDPIDNNGKSKLIKRQENRIKIQ